MGDSANTARERLKAKRVPKKKPSPGARSFGASTAIFVPPELQNEQGPKPKPPPPRSVVVKEPKPKPETLAQKRKRQAAETQARERLRLGLKIHTPTGPNRLDAVPPPPPSRLVPILGGHARMPRSIHDIGLGLGRAAEAGVTSAAQGVEDWGRDVLSSVLYPTTQRGNTVIPPGVQRAANPAAQVARPAAAVGEFVGSERGAEEVFGKALTNLVLHGDTPGTKGEVAGLSLGVAGILPFGKITQFAKLGRAARAAKKIGEALPMTPEREAAFKAMAQRVGEEQATDAMLVTDNIARNLHPDNPNLLYEQTTFHAGNYADTALSPGARYQTAPGERFGLVRGSTTDKIEETKLRLEPKAAFKTVNTFKEPVFYSAADETGLLFTHKIEKTGPNEFSVDSMNGGPPRKLTMDEAREELRTAGGRWTMEKKSTPGLPNETPVFYPALPEKVNQQVPKGGLPRSKLEEQLRGKPDKQGNYTGDIKDSEWEESGMPAFLDQYGPNEVVPKADIQKHLASPLNAYDVDEVIFSSNSTEFPAHWHTYPSQSPAAMVVKTPTPSEPYFELRMTLRRPLHTRVRRGVMGDRIEPAAYGSKGQVHWGANDVIAHVRFHLITDNDGKKALLVDEIQSDWASQWRDLQKAGGKEGLNTRLEEIKKELSTLTREQMRMDDQGGFTMAEMGDLEDEINKLHDEMDEIHNLLDGVPGAPPLGNKQIEAIVRRTLRFAEEAGVDRIIIVQGDVQAIRNMAFGKLPSGAAINVHSKDREVAGASLRAWRQEMGSLSQEELQAFANDPANHEGGIAATFFDVYGKRLPKVFEKEMGEKGAIQEGVFNGGFSDESGTVRRVHQGRSYQSYKGVDYKAADIPAVEGDIVGSHGGVGKLVKDGNSSLQSGNIYRPVTVELEDGYLFQTTYADVFKMVPAERMATGETPMGGYVIEMTEGAKAKARIPKPLYQQRAWEEMPKGATEFFADGTRAIHLFEGADISTIIHELSHVVLPDLNEVDRAILNRHFNGFATTADHEMYARALERYVYEGMAATSELDGTFARIRAWMGQVYLHVNNIGAHVHPEVKLVFDRMLVKNETPAEQLVRMLKTAPKVRKAQAAGYSVERGKRIEQMFDEWPEDASIEEVNAAMGALKGELPKEEFTGLDELAPEAVASIVRSIRMSPRVRRFEKVRAFKAVMNAVEGKVPTDSEIVLLNRIFDGHARFTKDQMGRIERVFVEVWNIPRSLAASFDLSAPLRQGLIAGTRHPIIFAKAFGPMFKALTSEERAAAIAEEIASRENYVHYGRGRLAVETSASSADLAMREEQFYSSYAERFIPPVKWSGRAYEAFLHRLRADIFDLTMEAGRKAGRPVESDEFVEGLGRMVNQMTGRGVLPEAHLLPLETAAPLFNTFLFSPRLLASRVNMISPVYYAKLYKSDPFLFAEATKNLATTVGALGIVLGSVTALGMTTNLPVTVGWDPTSANFGKIRIGDTRIDIMAGFGPLLVFLSREILGRSTSSTTGKSQDLKGGYGQSSRLDIAFRFAQSKAAPTTSIGLDWMRGQTFIGDPVTPLGEIKNSASPMMLRDVLDTWRSPKDPVDAAVAAGFALALGTFGIGFSTYSAKAKKSKSSGSGEGGPTWDSGNVGEGPTWDSGPADAGPVWTP